MEAFNVRDFMPLDFPATLGVLAGWQGREVVVIAHSQAPGAAMSHSQVTVAGKLGPVRMADNAIDPNVESAAVFAVGSEPHHAFYLSPGDFIHAQPLPGREHINIKFAHDFHIEVQLI